MKKFYESLIDDLEKERARIKKLEEGLDIAVDLRMKDKSWKEIDGILSEDFDGLLGLICSVHLAIIFYGEECRFKIEDYLQKEKYLKLKGKIEEQK